MQHLMNHDFNHLKNLLAQAGEPAFRVAQIWDWIYKKGVHDYQHMTNIPEILHHKLSHIGSIDRPRLTREQIARDGTRKSLLAFPDGHEIETVFIPEPTRGTVCVSSQVGCTLTCTFCHTGTQRLVRNLDPWEIISQFLLAKDRLKDWGGGLTERRTVTHIVMMGMGEPLYNYDHVRTALTILMDARGLGLSRRRITLSTSGVVPRIRECAKDLGVNLAVSLHAVRDDLRDTLVPLNRKYPIAELLAACRDYAAIVQDRRITFEYVMLNGVNDSDGDARELVRLIRGIPAKINLIPFNPWPGSGYVCSSPDRMRAFASIVEKAGYMSPVRKPRGDDILAACGQLKSDTQRPDKRRFAIS